MKTSKFFRIMCIIKKCREHGKFALAIILKDKVEKL